MRILICGDRNWFDGDSIRQTILKFKPDAIVEGEARGADSLARIEGEKLGIEILKFPADWNTYGKAAGPIRNSQMLREGQPDIVVGFHHNVVESKGTRDMLIRSKKAGKPTYIHNGTELKEF